MDKTFLFNHSLSELELMDAIDERKIKISALIDCLAVTHDAAIEIDREAIYNIIWIIQDSFVEIQFLEKQICNKKIKSNKINF
ncbi:MAG: hypothetical protein PVG30_00615 [Gammaproteobacteria bacterium]|jgi:hypothetical protein